jgi:hypothetical protein
MAIAILGGLVTSARLNPLVLPVLALRCGKCLLCSPQIPPLASSAARQKNAGKRIAR